MKDSNNRRALSPGTPGNPFEYFASCVFHTTIRIMKPNKRVAYGGTAHVRKRSDSKFLNVWILAGLEQRRNRLDTRTNQPQSLNGGWIRQCGN